MDGVHVTGTANLHSTWRAIFDPVRCNWYFVSAFSICKREDHPHNKRLLLGTTNQMMCTLGTLNDQTTMLQQNSGNETGAGDEGARQRLRGLVFPNPNNTWYMIVTQHGRP